jgi:hypothetical protein
MTTSDVDALILRLGSLERSCLRWRAFGACLAVVLAILGIAGAVAPPPKLLTLQTLRIVDEKGKERIVLDATGGDATLSVCDAGQAPRILLGVAPDKASFLMFGEGASETNRIMFGMGNTGAPLLLMKDTEGKIRLDAGVYPKAGAMLRIRDASKKMLVKLP